MPVGLQVFKNTRENYHITLFHTSKIFDPRPDATSPSGGVDSDLAPSERPSPTEVRQHGTAQARKLLTLRSRASCMLRSHCRVAEWALGLASTLAALSGLSAPCCIRECARDVCCAAPRCTKGSVHICPQLMTHIRPACATPELHSICRRSLRRKGALAPPSLGAPPL